ncbi:MAG: LacI family DNA-binding transcriptional regulator [Phycisphaeraceae bacterium]
MSKAPPKISQARLAAMLGVSQMTVSKALRGHTDISPRTRENVRRAAERLRYQPNGLARSLVDGHTHTIGLLLPRFRGHYYSRVLETLEDQIRQRGYTPLLTKGTFDDGANEQALQQLQQFRVAGYIIVPLAPDWNTPYFEQLVHAGERIVFLGPHESAAVPSTYNLDHEGAHAAVTHLHQLGHQHIACLQHPDPHAFFERPRVAGYRAAMRAADLAPRLIQPADVGDLQAACVRHLQSHPDTTAIFCCADAEALKAIRAAEQVGRRVPEDLSVIGFGDNLPYPDEMRVPLTTVAHDPQRIARTAVELLFSRLAGDTAVQHVPIENHLVHRASVGPCRST